MLTLVNHAQTFSIQNAISLNHIKFKLVIRVRYEILNLSFLTFIKFTKESFQNN